MRHKSWLYSQGTDNQETCAMVEGYPLWHEAMATGLGMKGVGGCFCAEKRAIEGGDDEVKTRRRCMDRGHSCHTSCGSAKKRAINDPLWHKAATTRMTLCGTRLLAATRRYRLTWHAWCLCAEERAIDDPLWHQADDDKYEDEGAGELYNFAQECLDRCVSVTWLFRHACAVCVSVCLSVSVCHLVYAHTQVIFMSGQLFVALQSLDATSCENNRWLSVACTPSPSV
eukprot:1158311-Pelagomonas_calceolata.AAC.1